MNIKRIIVLLMFAVAILGIIAPVNATIDSISKNKVYTIEAKEKTAKIKITWNSNGGKIGSKKTVTTTVTKGNKLNKLAKTPKRSKYAFKGWYSKKSGGKKITKDTKVTKNTIFFAQWKKKGTANGNSGLVGFWQGSFGFNKYNYILGSRYYTGFNHYHFSKDGTFKSFNLKVTDGTIFKGKYKVSGGKITFSDITRYNYQYSSKKIYGQKKYDTKVIMEYKIGKDNKGNYLDISRMETVPNTQDQYIRFGSHTRHYSQNSNPFTQFGL